MAPDRSAAVAFFALLVLAALPLAARADLYVCKTADGRTLTGDQPPRECSNSVIRQLNADGSVRRKIEPPLTPEERRKRDEEERERHAREMEAQAQLRKDRALLETYASEDEIESVRNRTLAMRKSAIDHATRTLDEIRADRKHLDEETEFYANRTMPDKLKRSIEDNTEQQEQQQRTIADLRLEMQQINDRYDGELRRFRELVNRGSTPVQH